LKDSIKNNEEDINQENKNKSIYDTLFGIQSKSIQMTVK
jgi:hypothetical protein